MSDAGAMAGRDPSRQPSEEELRAYVEQLRAAEPVEFVVQAYNMLATVAQAKLGRPDARIVIDAMSGLVEATADGLPADVARQMRDGVAQLKLAQVQAEPEAAAPSAGADDDETSGAGAAKEAPRAEPSQPGGRMTDRLWVPGRDPRPGGGGGGR